MNNIIFNTQLKTTRIHTVFTRVLVDPVYKSTPNF